LKWNMFWSGRAAPQEGQRARSSGVRLPVDGLTIANQCPAGSGVGKGSQYPPLRLPPLLQCVCRSATSSCGRDRATRRWSGLRCRRVARPVERSSRWRLPWKSSNRSRPAAGREWSRFPMTPWPHVPNVERARRAGMPRRRGVPSRVYAQLPLVQYRGLRRRCVPTPTVLTVSWADADDAIESQSGWRSGTYRLYEAIGTSRRWCERAVGRVTRWCCDMLCEWAVLLTKLRTRMPLQQGVSHDWSTPFRAGGGTAQA